MRLDHLRALVAAHRSRPGVFLLALEKRRVDGQALDRLRGGFSTKIRLKIDHDGQPFGFHVTGGEASDTRQFELLLDNTPRAATTDKGYDAKANRKAVR